MPRAFFQTLAHPLLKKFVRDGWPTVNNLLSYVLKYPLKSHRCAILGLDTRAPFILQWLSWTAISSFEGRDE